MKKYTRQEIENKLNKLIDMKNNQNNSYDLHINITLTDNVAKFYLIIQELKDIINMSDQEVIYNIINDGINEFFKKLYCIFSAIFLNINNIENSNSECNLESNKDTDDNNSSNNNTYN